MTGTDRLVALYILDAYRSDHPWHDGCESLRVVDADACNSTYGCDTGCDYVRFTATIACEHQEPTEFEFGELANIIKDIEHDYGDGMACNR